MISQISHALPENGRAYCSHAIPDWTFVWLHINFVCLLSCKWHAALPAGKSRSVWPHVGMQLSLPLLLPLTVTRHSSKHSRIRHMPLGRAQCIWVARVR